MSCGSRSSFHTFIESNFEQRNPSGYIFPAQDEIETRSKRNAPGGENGSRKTKNCSKLSRPRRRQTNTAKRRKRPIATRPKAACLHSATTKERGPLSTKAAASTQIPLSVQKPRALDRRNKGSVLYRKSPGARSPLWSARARSEDTGRDSLFTAKRLGEIRRCSRTNAHSV